MKFKFLIVTDPENSWIIKKLPKMSKLMELSKDIDSVEFVVKYKSGLVPVADVNGRIDQNWYRRNITEDHSLDGYLGSIFLFNEDLGKKCGIDSGLRGSYLRNGDEFLEGWVKSNENQEASFKDGTVRDRVTKTIPHEIAHGLKEFGYTDLEIHDFDYKNEINNIEGFYRSLIIAPTKLSKITLLLFTVKRLLRFVTGMKDGEYSIISPLPEEYWSRTSQPYGVPNKRYPKTEIHIGADIPCPVGTKIVARMNGAITKSSYTDTLGFYCYFEYIKNGSRYVDRLLHLMEAPALGKYNQGDTIALSGNTGDSDGPHLHIETWYDKVSIEEINKHNWNQLTVDPKSLK